MKKKRLSSKLSSKQFRAIETLMDPKQHYRKAVDRLVETFAPSLDNDKAEIRSIAAEAALRAVRTYPNIKHTSVCKCGEPTCSAFIRVSVRMAKNAILNAIEARNTQKRGGDILRVDMDEEWKPTAESFMEAAIGGLETRMTNWSTEKSVEAFRLGNPLQRVINLQIVGQIKDAERSLTVPQQAVFRLAMNPSTRVLSEARRLEAEGVKRPFLVAAQRSTGASDGDVKVVESAIRGILLL